MRQPTKSAHMRLAYPLLGNRWTLCQASGQSVPDNLSLRPRPRVCLTRLLRHLRRGIPLVSAMPRALEGHCQKSCRLM
jgi:hypothetical protein